MTLDKNAKHLRTNIIGMVLSLVAFSLLVVVSATGVDRPGVAHALLLGLSAVAGGYFSCGVIQGAHNRR